MASNFDNRINNLRIRRSGYDRINQIDESAKHIVNDSYFGKEAWQDQADARKPATRYALGAMAPVAKRQTEISHETFSRVEQALKADLLNAGEKASFRMQGSVPMNTHIRGVSDVDMLVILGKCFLFDPKGTRAINKLYTILGPGQPTVAQEIIDLRKKCYSILKKRYPAANIDDSNAKSIQMNGGSLARPVDVVPSSWFESCQYQITSNSIDKGVVIIDKTTMEEVTNYPFLFASKINHAGDLTNDGLRMAIRLCKNLKEDLSTEQGLDINLSSYDIASLMHQSDLARFRVTAGYPLAALGAASDHLGYLAANIHYAETLETPDGTRKILDKPEKTISLRLLSREVSGLAESVAREAEIIRYASLTPELNSMRNSFDKLYFPHVDY